MIILCGMWSVWRARNDRQHNKAPIDMRAAINWALDVCFNLLSVKESVGVHKGLKRSSALAATSSERVEGQMLMELSQQRRTQGLLGRWRETLMAMSRKLPTVPFALAGRSTLGVLGNSRPCGSGN
jgi:hypothetical protein